MNISQHAKERYAERIMGRENKTDISVFISQHQQKIADDIEKMIVYGKLIYSGKSIKNPNTKSDVYIKDKWVIIHDPGKDNVVTLYNIDLGIGDEFDQQFINTALAQIESAKAAFSEKEAELKETLATYKDLIDDNEKRIADCKSLIRSMETQNQAYKDIITSLKADLDIADRAVREKVEVLTGRRIF